MSARLAAPEIRQGTNIEIVEPLGGPGLLSCRLSNIIGFVRQTNSINIKAEVLFAHRLLMITVSILGI